LRGCIIFMSTPPSSRREFLSQAGFAAAGTLLALKAAGASQTAAPPAVTAAPLPPRADEKHPWGVVLQQTGWNIASTRFIDPPTWTWNTVPGAAGYVVMYAGEQEAKARTLRLSEPRYDMAGDWGTIPVGPVNLIAWAVDAQDRPLGAAWPLGAHGGKRFNKSPGFDGVAQAPLDWAASVERAMAYLLAPARDAVRPYEGDMPRSCWSSTEESISGHRRMLAFPALHHPSYILAYLAYARTFPEARLSAEAVRQARQYGDWLLAHRQPENYRCSLFPFSTIENGEFAGWVEGTAITLFRAARVGEAMIELALYTKEDRYLAYARHLADTILTMQLPDGSWPYRVNPKDGWVVEAYSSGAITPARLLGMLEAIEPNPRYAAAREKAARWVLANPVRTRRWQGMFEDISAKAPYEDLEHDDTNETIWYLAHYRPGQPDTLRMVEELNRYIEDQFVVFDPDDLPVTRHGPTPIVLEQYSCYYPMEVHTSIWLQSLIALHRTTGKDEYLTKAINAGNTIVRIQQETGAYSTWGFDRRFGRPLLTLDWPGCNAIAVVGLLRLLDHVKRLPGSKKDVQPL
jgi:hypothetical protein